MSLLVRPVEHTDVTAVVELVRDVLTEFNITFGQGSETDAQLEGLPRSYADRQGAFFVAELGGQLIGTAGVFPLGEAHTGVFELRKMYLRPAARGAGAGQQLFNQCLKFVRSHQARQLVLDTTEQMTAAIAFYERNGFVRDDTQQRASRCSRGYRLDL
jgi:putative acetyltransferase